MKELIDSIIKAGSSMPAQMAKMAGESTQKMKQAMSDGTGDGCQSEDPGLKPFGIKNMQNMMNQMMGGMMPDRLTMDPDAWIKAGQSMIERVTKGDYKGFDPRSWLDTGNTLIKQMTGSARTSFDEMTRGNMDPGKWVEIMRKMMMEMAEAMGAGTCCGQSSSKEKGQKSDEPASGTQA